MQTRNLIGGQWVSAGSGREIEVADPATDEVVARVPDSGVEETRAAVDAAEQGLLTWRVQTGAERQWVLRRLALLMHEREEELSRLLSLEHGKPLSEAVGELRYAASFVDWAADEAPRIYGDVVPASQAEKRILVLRQPVGITAAITPWNFPSAMITRKLGPALATGCAMIVKPAPETPLSALALAELALEAGVPAGVVNVLTGDAPTIAGALLSDGRVHKLSFTGSTEVGRILMRRAAEHLTRLSLELGGHAPFIVFEDADLDRAVAGALASKLRNMGQSCIASNRFLVQEGVYEAFSKKLCAAMQNLKLGSALTPGVQVGPLINDLAIQKVERHVKDAKDKGARVLCGGARARIPGLSHRFYQPTVLDGYTPDMLLAKEETFGPVAPLRRFRDEDEAVQLANDSVYGLAAYFFTESASRLLRVAERLEYGIVGANDGAPSTAQAPFGGIKESGFGREGGRYVMDEYTNVKYISWGL